MIRRAAFLLVLGLAAGCASAGGSPDASPPAGRSSQAQSEAERSIAPASGVPGARPACATILSTNDTHGQLLPRTFRWTRGAPVGGAAALGGYFRDIREASAGCPVFLLSGGDVMQGTPISNLVDGESTIAAFNALGYDAAATGNHEFDWGVHTFRSRIEQARFPFLGANVYWKGTDRHPEWLQPYVILERDGVRLGVIGLATVETPTTTRPRNVEALHFRPIGETLDRYIPEVRSRGVDFIVVIMHAGGFCKRDAGCSGEAIRELSRTTAPFDYAVTGHTHSRIRTEIGGAPVVQSRYSTASFGIGRLERRADGSVERTLLDIVTPFADSVAPDTAVQALVEGYRARVAEIADRPVMHLAEALPSERGPRGDFALGRLIADAQRAATGAEVAIMNNGGIRTGLAAGPVTYGDLFRVQPFQNTLVRLRLRGRHLLAALEHALEDDGPDANVSGLRVRYDPGGPHGGRIRDATLDDGRRVHADSLYLVVANDFMATGGSGFVMLAEAEASENTGIVDLEALIEYLADLPQPVRAPVEPRWIPMHRE